MCIVRLFCSHVKEQKLVSQNILIIVKNNNNTLMQVVRSYENCLTWSFFMAIYNTNISFYVVALLGTWVIPKPQNVPSK